MYRIDLDVIFCQQFDLGFRGLQDKYKSNPKGHFSILFESHVFVHRSRSFRALLKQQLEIYFHIEDTIIEVKLLQSSLP